MWSSPIVNGQVGGVPCLISYKFFTTLVPRIKAAGQFDDFKIQKDPNF